MTDRAALEREREQHGIQLHAVELEAILAALRPGASLLVFGLGNDSGFWAGANPGGRTAFLEDDPRWFAEVRARSPGLEAYLVSYATRREEWRELLDAPARLALELPPAIAGRRWDVILVDGPAGYAPGTPGRMKSLYAAAQLVADGGDIFVHDVERRIETAYTRRYFARFSIVGEVAGRALLRHYRADGHRLGARRLYFTAAARFGELRRAVRRAVRTFTVK